MGPYLDDQGPGGTYGAPTPTVRAGDRLTLFGHFYASTCHDVVQFRADGTRVDDGRRIVPLPEVHLTVTFADGRVERLGPFTPGGDDFGFAATVQLSDVAVPGTVTVADDRAFPATYRFQIIR